MFADARHADPKSGTLLCVAVVRGEFGALIGRRKPLGRRDFPEPRIRAFRNGVSVLPPAMDVSEATDTKRLPLGAALIADLRVGIGVLDQLAGLAREFPWCPACLIATTLSLDSRLLRALKGLPDFVGVVRSGEECGGLIPEDVFRAINERPPPTAAVLARYVAHRLGRLALPTDLERCFAQAMGDSNAAAVPRTTLWRHLAGLGPLTQRDWMGVAQLILLLRDARVSSIDSADRFSHDHGLDPRTLRARLRRLAGVELAVAIERPGWEWFLESVLRRHAYMAIVPQWT